MRYLRWFLPALLASATRLIADPLVIAHRGASGYLPEHTLASAVYAHALGADYIEQDVVLSRDNVLVVLHDIHLDTTTDVVARYPERRRADGRYYAVDFTWAELATLTVRERFNPLTGEPVLPDRFSANGVSFRLCTLAEQITLIAGLNRATGRKTGIYVEFKEPAWHAREGKDLGATLLAELGRLGFNRAADSVFVQCFDAAALRRLRTELKTELRLVQLIGTGEEQASLLTPDGLREVAAYAQGIGPSLRLLTRPGADGRPELTTLVRDAHALGLLVHPYTVRADSLPADLPTVEALLDLILQEAQVDGFFIDQPDHGVRAVARLP